MAAPLKVLIIGGGVAGPALAYWLSRLGNFTSITLAERSSSMRASGQQVDLRGQGVPMMQKMGIEAAVRAAVVHEVGMQLVDLHGQTKAFFPAAQTGDGRQSFTSEYEIMRGDLVGILYGLTEGKGNVRHLFGTTVDALTQDDPDVDDGKVHVRFRDGHDEDFDLVVGADGTSSKTRGMMLGPDAPDPRVPLGGYIGYYSIPSRPGDSDRGTFCHLPGGVPRVIGTRKDCADLTRVYMIMRGRDSYPGIDAAYKSGDLQQLRDAWADMYADGGWETPRFVDALRRAPEAADFYCTPFEEVNLPKGDWSRGRVVLLGDAAHCQTAGGFGCTWGLIGAYVLAGEIASRLPKPGNNDNNNTVSSKKMITEAVVEGAKAYEEKFRPIATANHGRTKSAGAALMFPTSSLGIRFLQAFARVAAYFRMDQAVGWSDKTAAWELPHYPELEGEEVGVGQN